MRTPSLSIASVLLLAAVFVAACTTEEGVTPDCEQNVGPDGITPSESGCFQFAVCNEGDGNPTNCCGNPQGGGDCDIERCLYGYGVPIEDLTPSCFGDEESTGGGG